MVGGQAVGYERRLIKAGGREEELRGDAIVAHTGCDSDCSKI